MKENYSIRVSKQYFNFACSHFMVFKDGTREPLHGHNYKVRVQGHHHELNGDMVIDFLDIKPIVRKVCDSLDHKLLIQGENPDLIINRKELNFEIITPDKSFFSIPATDVLILPINNTSVERLAMYLAKEISQALKDNFNYSFSKLEIEVEETEGQSAIYRLEEEVENRL